MQHFSLNLSLLCFQKNKTLNYISRTLEKKNKNILGTNSSN